MHRFCKYVLLASAASVLAPWSTAQAAEDQSNTLGEIIVTARRVEERLQDVPISITVYNQDQLDRRNIVSAADLGAYTPSLATNERYGPDKATFAIRGFVQDLGTAPSVGVYFADTVGPRAADPTGGGEGVAVGNLFDLQSVQVLKGPQGTLFGRNTTGGAVLLVPQKPTDRSEGYIEGSYGNYDMRRVQAVVNIPFNDKLRVRFGVDRMQREGYEKNEATGDGPSRFANVDYLAGRVSVVADLADNLENYTIGSYTRSTPTGVLGRIEGCITPQQFAAAPPAAQAQLGVGLFYGCAQLNRQTARGDGFWDVESTHPESAIRSKQWQIINTTTWHASDNLTVKNIFNYEEIRMVDRFSVGGDNFLNPLNPAATRPDLTLIFIANTPGYDNAAQSTFSEELQFQGNTLDGRLEWQGGGYFENSNPLGYSSQFVTSFLNCADAYDLQCAGRGAIANSFLKTWYRNRGVYAQGTYKITDKLSLTAGGRYTWDTTRQYFAATAIAFPAPNVPFTVCTSPRLPFTAISVGQFQPCGLTFEAKSDAPTWVIDLDYKPTDDIMVYGKWARGYRAGGVNASIPYFETWGPEKVDTFETGVKTSFASIVRGYANAALFYNNFRNQQIQAGLVTANPAKFTGGSAVINAGKSRIWGFEFDGSVALTADLRIDLGYTYLNTELQKLDPPSVPAAAAGIISAVNPTAEVNGPLALSPKNRVTVTGSYTLPIHDARIGVVSFNVSFTHTDKQVASISTIDDFGTLPPENLLDLNLTWKDVAGRPLEVSAFATNVTNEAFPVNITNLGAAFGFESYIPNEPRMYGVRLRYRFGS